eukprot:gnl/TRDRNA2_/TRDRNA2_188522_c0_seq1.p1 gnl/TRDRNA2_/TRDRNA2_188522_c0~~gnl/TRDRNA2_/TRDRNA2_188522_c0_seq1.p1  ORF type:complete len:434 (+),score=71.32 gnl/TRDRNA2_/TRDRNA2_188522_c0_seq1:165-1466(+)
MWGLALALATAVLSGGEAKTFQVGGGLRGKNSPYAASSGYCQSCCGSGFGLQPGATVWLQKATSALNKASEATFRALGSPCGSSCNCNCNCNGGIPPPLFGTPDPFTTTPEPAFTTALPPPRPPPDPPIPDPPPPVKPLKKLPKLTPDMLPTLGPAPTAPPMDNIPGRPPVEPPPTEPPPPPSVGDIVAVQDLHETWQIVNITEIHPDKTYEGDVFVNVSTNESAVNGGAIVADHYPVIFPGPDFVQPTPPPPEDAFSSYHYDEWLHHLFVKGNQTGEWKFDPTNKTVDWDYYLSWRPPGPAPAPMEVNYHYVAGRESHEGASQNAPSPGPAPPPLGPFVTMPPPPKVPPIYRLASGEWPLEWIKVGGEKDGEEEEGQPGSGPIRKKGVDGRFWWAPDWEPVHAPGPGPAPAVYREVTPTGVRIIKGLKRAPR